MKAPDGYVILIRSDGKATSVDLETLELVKCKNCKHLVAHGGGEAYHCWIHGTSVEEDDWCSWAEARGEE